MVSTALVSQWRAWPAGADPSDVARANSRARETFLSSGSFDGGVRRLVADSWQRCLRHGVAPEGPNPSVDLVDDQLGEYRAAHPLAAVMTVVRRLLVADAADAELLVAVSDARGRLLWVEGSRRLRRRAEAMNFAEGAMWDEASAGTNAPGTALALDHPLQIFGAEHLRAPVTGFSCSAAPIHGPDGAILGALDITGDQEAAAPHTLQLVTVVAAAVEAELRVQHLTRGRRTRRGSDAVGTGRVVPEVAPLLRVLGTGRAVLELPGPGRRVMLRQRHGEMLLLLAEAPRGLTADDFDVALHVDATSTVTARAEVARLRGVLAGVGGPEILGRPYRLAGTIASDVAAVRASLARGEVAAAVAAYAGPLLPASEAPAVVRLRETLADAVRTAVLTSAAPDVLWKYAHAAEQACDLDVWRACAGAFEPGSARHTDAAGHVRMLDHDLAVRP